MEDAKLFMLLLGCKPAGRNTEQHDIFFGIGTGLKDLLPDIYEFWPEAGHKIHIDAWREVTQVDGYSVSVMPKMSGTASSTRLFFINLGGYKSGEFEEFHYKMLVAAPDKGAAIRQAKQTAFYRHTGFKGATSHIDDKYGVDVDDMYEITEILPASSKQKYSLHLTPSLHPATDELILGYTRPEKL